MFEKEADFAETKMLINCNGDYSKKKDYKKGWQDGAEFGYNKANEEISELNEEISELKSELKVENAFCEKSCEGADQMRKDLKMAKEIIQKLSDTQYRLDPYRDIFKDRIAEAKQFISEVKI